MATALMSLDQRMTVGVFETVAQAATVIDRLLDAGVPRAALGLLLPDRTAERHFGPRNARNELGAEGTYSAEMNTLARSLRPIAGLGMPGSGLVGVGPLPAALVSAGLGSQGGLERALKELGVDAERAGEVARRVKNGAVLVSSSLDGASNTQRSAMLLEHEAALGIQLDLARPIGPGTVVAQPSAPIAEQSARYEPVIDAGEDTRVTRTGVSH